MDGKTNPPTKARLYLPLFSIAAIVLILIGGYLLYRQNLYTLTGRDGRRLCRVKVGWTQQEVTTHCGPATGTGMQPKITDSGSGLFDLRMCSAPGDVYGAKAVLYGCDGKVEAVERMPAQGFLYYPAK